MAFSDWDFFESTTGVAGRGVDQDVPIVGNGSLIIDSIDSGVSSSANNRSINWLVSDASAINHGFPHGKVRSVINVENFSGGGYRVGLICMQSIDNLSVSGNCYIATLHHRPGSGISHRVSLEKITGGITTGTVLSLGNTANDVYTLGNDAVLELEFDASSGIQTDFVVRFADNTTDFGLLSDVITVTDNTSPHITSVGEGGMIRLTTTTEQVKARYDTTELFQILP